ncbi:MAG: hypothetical protein VB957_02575 [Pseudomonadales bacterium]
MKYIVATLVFMNLVYLCINLWPQDDRVVNAQSSFGKRDVVSISLLNEKDGPRQKSMEQVVNNPILLSDRDDLKCQAIGPFSSITMGQSVLERLEAMDVAVQLRALDTVLDQYDYRVLILPTKSIEAAFRKLRELQSQGIDSYVITQGKDAMGISMGVYSSQNAAELVKLQLATDGYDATIRKIGRLQREYWIFSRRGGDLNIPETLMSIIQEQVPQLQYGARYCAGS